MSRFVISAVTVLFFAVVLCMAGCGSSDRSSSVSGNAPNNQVTQAKAGADQYVVTGSNVLLDGSQSTGANGSLIEYQWSMGSHPPGSAAIIQNQTRVNPTFTADMSGVYIVKLIVTDDQFTSSEDTITVTASIANAAPVANAGNVQNVSTGSLVTLDGSASSDANGDLLTYSWAFTSKPEGSSAVLSNASEANPTFRPDVEGAYVINLVVNDGTLNSIAALVTVTASIANAAPVANAGNVQNVSTGSLVTLDGSASSDANGDLLTYSWAFTSKPEGSSAVLSNTSEANPTFRPDVEGVYVINLVVNDGMIDSFLSSVSITAANDGSVYYFYRASFWTGNTVPDPAFGSWDKDARMLEVKNQAEDWQVKLEFQPINVIAGKTYEISLNCSNLDESSYTIQLQKNVNPWTKYDVKSAKCDGKQTTVNLIPAFSDQAAILSFNFGATAGKYFLSNTVTVKEGMQNPIPIIPDGATCPWQRIGNPLPQNYSAVNFWGQSAKLSSSQSTEEIARVTVDYWKMIEIIPGIDDKEVYIDNYDSVGFGESGLYLRSPYWFPTDEHNEAYPSVTTAITTQDGNKNILFNINLSDIGDPDKPRIVHWWTKDRHEVIPGATYSAEIRFKVEGKTAVQFGSDWWRDLKVDAIPWDQDCSKMNNCEAWVSDWFGDTSGDFITIKVPR